MRRLLIAGTIVLASVTASALAASDPHATLRNFVCQRALDPPARAIQVVAVMKTIQGTRKLRMRFELRMKPKGQSSYQEISGGDLGKWLSPSNPTLGQRPGDQWIVKKQVVDLAAPATYRFRVSFRWLGSHDRLLASAVRLSKTCYQPELRPDLLVESIQVEPVSGSPQLNRYVAVIRNGGASAAGMFGVQFNDGSVTKTKPVQSLAAHSTVQRSFVGPACTSGGVTIVADPDDKVDDYNRANNSMTATCPGQ